MKKYLSIILVVIMTCMFAMGVCADEKAEASFVAIVEEKDALQGEVVEVNVCLQNNPGVLAMLLVLNYDVECMELIDIKDGGLLAGAVFGQDYLATPYKMLWNSASKVNFSEDGVLVTLVFKVKENANPGMTDVTLSFKSKNVYDVDLNDVELNVKNGGVFIADSDEGAPSKPEVSEEEEDDEDAEDDENIEDSSKRKPSSSVITITTPNKTENSKAESSEENVNMGDTSETDDEVEKNKETEETEEDFQVYLMDYSDVKSNDWFYESIQFVSENNLMNGMSEGCFAPEENVTRAMFVTILYRIEGIPTTAGHGFSDVEKDFWYEDAVSWANTNGIVNGISNEIFAPYECITREQMATMIFRYFKYKNFDVSLSSDNALSKYNDSKYISDYAVEPLSFTCEQGIIKGLTDSEILPQGNATRAQAATVFKRILENEKWGQLLPDKM